MRYGNRQRKRYVQNAAGVELSAYLCDDERAEPDVYAYIDEFVEETATAVAKASVRTTIDCEAVGDASAFASASGRAAANATASATAILEGWAGAGTCAGCDAYVDLWLESTKTVFVAALAQHEDSLEVFSTAARPDRALRETVTEDVKEALVRTWVSAFIELYAGVSNGDGGESCYADVAVNACAGTGDAEACCDFYSGSGAYSFVEEAVAESGAHLPRH